MRAADSIRLGMRVARLLLLAPLLIPTACTETPPTSPNLVLLIGDDLGYRDYGFMGSPVVKTPRLDRLAAEGVTFTHGYSTASVCRPALATLLTGLEPLALYFREHPRRRRGSDAEPLIASLETLPRLLARRGYATFEAGKHWEGPYRLAGFAGGMVDRWPRNGANEQWHLLLRSTLEPVFEFVEENGDGPFFLWFAPLLPHLPHDAPMRFRALYPDMESPAARYYAAISWLDDGIGRLVDHIQELGLERRTLFVYVADNGWDLGGPEHAGALLGGPKGKMTLYELGFRTPVILRWLGGIEPQPARAELVSLTDVFATLLDYGGASLPAGRQGHSLRPLLEGVEAWPRRDIVGWMESLRGEGKAGRPFRRGGFFWRDPRWHYLQPAAARPQLFDLDADPFETTDVSEEHPEVVARASERLQQWTRSLTSPSKEPAAAP